MRASLRVERDDGKLTPRAVTTGPLLLLTCSFCSSQQREVLSLKDRPYAAYKLALACYICGRAVGGRMIVSSHRSSRCVKGGCSAAAAKVVREVVAVVEAVQAVAVVAVEEKAVVLKAVGVTVSRVRRIRVNA